MSRPVSRLVAVALALAVVGTPVSVWAAPTQSTQIGFERVTDLVAAAWLQFLGWIDDVPAGANPPEKAIPQLGAGGSSTPDPCEVYVCSYEGPLIVEAG